jgi:hypothetical protein
LDYQSWAIQLDPKDLDQQFWKKRGVDIINRRLADYVAALGNGLKALKHWEAS